MQGEDDLSLLFHYVKLSSSWHLFLIAQSLLVIALLHYFFYQLPCPTVYKSTENFHALLCLGKCSVFSATLSHCSLCPTFAFWHQTFDIAPPRACTLFGSTDHAQPLRTSSWNFDAHSCWLLALSDLPYLITSQFDYWSSSCLIISSFRFWGSNNVSVTIYTLPRNYCNYCLSCYLSSAAGAMNLNQRKYFALRTSLLAFRHFAHSAHSCFLTAPWSCQVLEVQPRLPLSQLQSC